MKNIRIVIVSKDESLRMTNDFIKQSIFQDGINVTTSIILNNKESIYIFHEWFHQHIEIQCLLHHNTSFQNIFRC